ncbi:MAG: rhomboid family intramembrane serine protease [Phycisphaeraceae bacterium]|nr:rhomboid family intramembrane serine protease [Phycisphaeraceae bacterium]
MGLADRSYMTDRPARGRGPSFSPGAVGGFPRFSVNTWLIILCAAVFILDPFLPARWVFQGVEWPRGMMFADSREEHERFKTLTAAPDGIKPVTQGPVVPGSVGVRLLLDAAGRPVAREVYRAEPFFYSWLYFSTSSAVVHRAPDGSLRGFEFWRFIGFQFLHGGIWHIAFNMIGLWFFGPIVERTLGGKRYLAFYLLCGIAGALMYLLLNGVGTQAVIMFGPQAMKWAPFLLFNDPETPLVGASAGVFGVLMAGAYLVPHARVYVWGILPMRMDTLAYVLVGVALFTVIMQGNNAGGEAAHIGGAIAGWYFIRNPNHLHGFFDFLGRADPTSRSRRARSGGAAPRPSPRDLAPDRAEVDRILEKVSREGLQSLSRAEQEALRRASRSSRN